MGNYPSHGFHCNAKTFPIKCRYCDQSVFYFSCDCGSKVFFEELGSPWPQHACIERGITILGKERIEQEIANRMMSSYMNVDYERHVQRGASQNIKKLKQDERNIVRLDPYNKVKMEEGGIIRELSLDINIFRKFKIEDTPSWHRSLTKLLSEPQAQVTIHTGAIGDDDPYSITFFVEQKVIKQKALTIGDFVQCNLIGYPIPGREPVWICGELRSAYD